MHFSLRKMWILKSHKYSIKKASGVSKWLLNSFLHRLQQTLIISFTLFVIFLWEFADSESCVSFTYVQISCAYMRWHFISLSSTYA